MSTKKEIIELSPDPYSSEEVIEVGGFLCPYCNGRKSFIREIGRGEVEEEICPYCHGAGIVRAIVSVAWRPQIKK